LQSTIFIVSARSVTEAGKQCSVC